MAGTKLEKLQTVDLGERTGGVGTHFHAHSHPCNQISTEAIAIFSVTTSILWTQSYMLGSTFSTDGSTLNTTSQGNLFFSSMPTFVNSLSHACFLSYLVWWWYTPTSGVARGGTNVDVGKQALLEVCLSVVPFLIKSIFVRFLL